MLKNIFYLLIITLSGCDVRQDGYSLIDKLNKTYGTDRYTEATVSFSFRDRDYTTFRGQDGFVYTRSFMDTSGFIIDSLKNSADFSRYVNGALQTIDDDTKRKYANSVNSVLYFFQLPLVLKDAAVNPVLLENVEIDGQAYQTLKVSFGEDNGGQDHDDEFRYWVNTQTGYIDFIAYSYLTNGGGVRFRQAINRREIDGLVIQDYINFGLDKIQIDLDDLPTYWSESKLMKLSEITHQGVQIKRVDTF